MGKLSRIINRLCRREIIFNPSLQTEPVSRIFGLDRGMPIDRYYIERFLEKNASCISGKVLEISESTYSHRFGKNVSHYGVLHYDHSNRKATITGDLTRPASLPEKEVDCFICTQTLNFIFEINKAVEGCYRLLKPGGVFLGTVAGISQISRYDMDRWGDYWRFTDRSITKLFEHVFGEKNVEVETFGNVLSSTAFLQGLSLEDIEDVSLLDKKDVDYQMLIGIKAVRTIE